MKFRAGILFIAVAVLIVVAAGLWLRDEGSLPPSSSTPEVAVPPAAPAPEVAELAPTVAPETVPSEAKREAIPVAEQAPAPSKPAPKLATLRVRLTSESGAPIANAAAQLRGWSRNTDAELKFGRPKDWKDLDAKTDAEGKLAIEFDPPRAFQFILEIATPGFPHANWRFSEIDPGSDVDLGTIALPNAGVVEGRVLDANGNTPAGNWSVRVDSDWVTPGANGTVNRDFASVTNGTFRVEGVAPGKVHVRAEMALIPQPVEATTEVASNQTAHVDLRYLGPDASTRIHVSTFNSPFFIFSTVDASVVALRASSGELLRPQADAQRRSSQTHVFEDVPSGDYTLEIRDPRFEPIAKSGVRAGQSVSVDLRGASGIALEVMAVDKAGASVPVEDYRLRVRYPKANMSPNEFEVRAAEKPAPAGGIYSGIVPGDLVLSVDVEGKGHGEIAVDGLVAGETRRVSVKVLPTASVSGLVTRAGTAQPCAGVSVHLGPPAAPRNEKSNNIMADLAVEKATHTLESAADGSFRFDDVAPGTYELKAIVNERWQSPVMRFEVLPGEPYTFDLLMPGAGTLEGRILQPSAFSLEDLTIGVRQDGDSRMVQIFGSPFQAKHSKNAQPSSANLDDQGKFVIGPLTAGRYEVKLKMPDAIMPQAGNGTSSLAGSSFALGSVDIVADRVTTVEYDLGERMPGIIDFQLILEGGKPEDYGVSAVVHEDGKYWKSEAGAKVSADGKARLGPVAPGNYRFVVNGLSVPMMALSSEQVTVAPGALASATVQLKLIRDTITFLDADGKPATKDPILLWSLDYASSASFVKTDELGNASLALPAGEYVVTKGPGRPPIEDTTRRFVWPPATREWRFEAADASK